MKALLILVLSCFALGCTRYAPRASHPLNIYNASVNAEVDNPSWLVNYDAKPSVELRNHLLNEFVWTIDRNFDRFEIAYYTNKASADIVGDFLGIGLGGAGVLVGAQHTKTILAMAATAIVGGKASIDAHWTDNQTRNAIVAMMEKLRADQKIALMNGMGAPLDQYTLDQGIIDCQALYQAGSIFAALQALVQQANAQSAISKGQLLQMRSTHR